MPWVVAGASTTGPRHHQHGAPCDDAHARATVGPIAILVVCDGAGSARHGRDGARHVAGEIASRVEQWCSSQAPGPDLHGLSDEVVRSWFVDTRASLAALAASAGLMPRDYHCTAILVLATPVATLAAHIGDGVAIRYDPTEQWTALSWPEQGVFAGETVFVDDATLEKDLRIARTGPSSAVAAASDGFDPFLVQHAQQRVLPHQVEPLRQALSGGNPATNWDAPLADFIGNPVFDEHADDDRTLVIAVWRE